MTRRWALRVAMACLCFARALPPSKSRADEPSRDAAIVLAGPSMGTTYRVLLAEEIPGLSRGELHREVEAVLARIDHAASTWRADSDVSQFNRASAGVWLEVSEDLAALVEIAGDIHAETNGRFDITIAPLIDVWQAADRRRGRPSPADLAAARGVVGMQFVELHRPAAGVPRLRKTREGVRLDLGGIGPGYAVDCIGERLADLGSEGHLVTLGGEARSWGCAASGNPWRLMVRLADADAAAQPLELADGEAIAFSTPRPGRSPIDPRTGNPVTIPRRPVIVRSSSSCSRADALAVAAALNASEGP
jgi:thiamine biosynthesis lipoprotein